MKSHDLPEIEFLYISSVTPLINVDLFVVNENGEVLLSWRDDDYCGKGWHIPGGIIRHGETMEERIIKTANSELGFIPQFDFLPCKITEIFLNQEYRNHFISHLFIGKCLKKEVSTKLPPEKAGDLCWFSNYPEKGLVYSQEVYEKYLKEYFLKSKN